MKFPTKLSVVFSILFVLASCAKESEKTRADAEAKARAEAARKEMQTLPKVFKTPEYFKKNEPTKNDAAQPTPPAPKE